VLGPAGGVVRRRRGVRVVRGRRVDVRGDRVLVRGDRVVVWALRVVVPVEPAAERLRRAPAVRGRLLRLVVVLRGARPVADSPALRTAAAVPAAPARIALPAAAAAGPT
jgi:hypothetical protein